MKDIRRITSLLLTWTLFGLVTAASGLSLPSILRQNPLNSKYNQHPIMANLPGFLQPGQGSENPDNPPVISDVLPKTKGINVFSQLTRDFDPVASRLNDATKNVTVLAPRNSAIQALPRKPWENPEDYAKFGEANAYEGQDGQDRAKQNLQKFVEAHVIPVSPWKEGEEVETMGGEKLKWVKDGDKMIIQPGNVQVNSIAERVSNGEVWVLDNVVNYR
ncbi:hypothetical protein N7468_005924 [Penicillium chermesinum]|uniref:FAS1 domain-containing protein n=1 Tax=Penicillium chermesinum TaxID=63820 RepID=A0A9W9P075_9EURO|nr:uncharacterized protein N7468_005924 [Penicillium chermesinum]KAJ5232968.1 hypothetical protein N7468_005924 [Penicillium chermesinum]KAJ6172616.1 hypothetical protein N7470_001683 [Penicillium chermesinum]